MPQKRNKASLGESVACNRYGTKCFLCCRAYRTVTYGTIGDCVNAGAAQFSSHRYCTVPPVLYNIARPHATGRRQCRCGARNSSRGAGCAAAGTKPAPFSDTLRRSAAPFQKCFARRSVARRLAAAPAKRRPCPQPCRHSRAVPCGPEPATVQHTRPEPCETSRDARAGPHRAGTRRSHRQMKCPMSFSAKDACQIATGRFSDNAKRPRRKRGETQNKST